MTEPRPTKATEEMILAAAKEVASYLITDGLIEPDELPAAALDIARSYSPNLSGYDLAKALDSIGWDCDMEFLEILDGFGTLIGKAIGVAEEQWQEKNNITPAHEVGTEVHFKFGSEVLTGVIEGVYQYGVARYIIAVDGMKGCPIIKFEDVANV